MNDDPTGEATLTRQERRKARTRASLLAAAQHAIATQGLSASINDITDAADVGVGSAYYHFATKEELFRAAGQQSLLEWEARILPATEHLLEPDRRFATRLRLFVRMATYHPISASVIVRTDSLVTTATGGYSSIAVTDARAALEQHGISATDEELNIGMLCLTGALVKVLALSLDAPHRFERMGDIAVRHTLCLLGLAGDIARGLVAESLAAAVPALAAELHSPSD